MIVGARPDAGHLERQPSPAPARDTHPPFRPGDAACRASAEPDGTPRRSTMAETGHDAGGADCRPRRSRSSCSRRARMPRRSPSGARSTASPRRDPAFISVTYGAGGSSRDRSLDRAPLHAREHRRRADGAPHVRRLVARRGEPPRARVPRRRHHELPRPARRPARRDRSRRGHLGDLDSAAELVQLIHRVQEEREPFAQVGMPGPSRRHADPRAAATRARRRRRVPERASALPRSPHRTSTRCSRRRSPAPTSRSRSCSSHADDYLGFVDRARAAGVTIPILPGIMPVTTPARLARAHRAHRRRAARRTRDRPRDRARRRGAGRARHRPTPPASPPTCSTAAHPASTSTPSTSHEAVLDVLDRLGLGTTARLVNERNTTER